jgi:2-(1,2-epoxy-1,2-dihydrophenyl)acetyl-CoA isomerase
MSYKTLTLEIDNYVATITLNRPEMMNAFSEQLIWDMGEATKAVKDDAQIRILVITGEGRGFTAGADLSERDASWTDTKDALERGYYPLICLNRLSAPLMALQLVLAQQWRWLVI